MTRIGAQGVSLHLLYFCHTRAIVERKRFTRHCHIVVRLPRRHSKTKVTRGRGHA